MGCVQCRLRIVLLQCPTTCAPVSSGGEGVHLWMSDEQQSLPTHRVFQQHSGTLGHQEQEHQQDSGGKTRV